MQKWPDLYGTAGRMLRLLEDVCVCVGEGEKKLWVKSLRRVVGKSDDEEAQQTANKTDWVGGCGLRWTLMMRAALIQGWCAMPPPLLLQVEGRLTMMA
jgi:hypothetical protein